MFQLIVLLVYLFDRCGFKKRLYIYTATDDMPNILTPDEREFYEERAAVMEYEGGLPRAEAENLAFERRIARFGSYWRHLSYHQSICPEPNK